MLDLSELAVSSVDEMIRKRRQLAEELAMLDTLIEHVRPFGANGALPYDRAATAVE